MSITTLSKKMNQKQALILSMGENQPRIESYKCSFVLQKIDWRQISMNKTSTIVYCFSL